MLAPPASGGDFNISWEVYEVVFTPQGVGDNAINTRITTEQQLENAIEAGDVDPPIDLGFTFTCAVVSQSVYDHGA